MEGLLPLQTSPLQLHHYPKAENLRPHPCVRLYLIAADILYAGAICTDQPVHTDRHTHSPKPFPSGTAYLVAGGTPAATTPRDARTILSAAPASAPDGLVNFYLDTTGNGLYTPNGATVGWENRAQDQPSCGIPIAEATACQIGFASTTTNGALPRPINAMANQGIQLL